MQGKPNSHTQPVMMVSVISGQGRCLNFGSRIRFDCWTATKSHFDQLFPDRLVVFPRRP